MTTTLANQPVPGVRARLKHWARSLTYPGLDLHVRNRASLRRYWKTTARDVLDAGSGNGYFSWLAYKSGAKVLALNIDAAQVAKAQRFLVDYRGANVERQETFELWLPAPRL